MEQETQTVEQTKGMDFSDRLLLAIITVLLLVIGFVFGFFFWI